MKVLLVVDVQMAFPVPPRLVSRLANEARRYDRRVFTRFLNPPDSLFRRRLGMTTCAPDTLDRALLVEPAAGDLILDKPSYGLKPMQIGKIRRLRPTTLHVCGVDTEACVLGVMFSLFDAGLRCELRPELCWSSNGRQREAVEIILQNFHPKKSR